MRIFPQSGGTASPYPYPCGCRPRGLPSYQTGDRTDERFGHFRFAEALLGGVTRTMLSASPILLFLAN